MSYKLQWENPDEDVIISYLSELYYSKHFADVTLVCKNQRRIKAHGVILAANSNMFQEILRNSEDFEILFDEVGLEEVVYQNSLLNSPKSCRPLRCTLIQIENICS